MFISINFPIFIGSLNHIWMSRSLITGSFCVYPKAFWPCWMPLRWASSANTPSNGSSPPPARLPGSLAYSARSSASSHWVSWPSNGSSPRPARLPGSLACSALSSAFSHWVSCLRSACAQFVNRESPVHFGCFWIFLGSWVHWTFFKQEK